MEAIIFANNNIYVDEVTVNSKSFLLNRKVKDIEFGRFKLLLFGVLRGRDFLFKPDKEFEFKENDLLIIFGNRESLEYFI
jgi:uncharacterized protein with PhoU and TrkA domain